MSVSAIIVAAGKGRRMNSSKPKQFLRIGNKPILAHTIDVFETSPVVSEIILVVGSPMLDYARRSIVAKNGFKKVKDIVAGGKLRQDSVYNGLKNISRDCSIVLIHDGVRPFITHAMIRNVVGGAKRHKACIFALPVKETVKKVTRGGIVRQTLNRDELVLVQTPQAFRYDVIMKAYEKATRKKICATDDAMIAEKAGVKVKVLPGRRENIKITTPDDLIFASCILPGGKRI
ncbi:MAG: 2-C-methyl-D-erythritol 4-phosphate cytidylyltransferase [bacterium]